ncbi:SDR family NAD(P)-dependent oxidoreductase [Aquabacterium sp. CECT 9606]|uniref:SDR family NAD(P)-dependent oxidoreductase n=1 Tax=Aquabacterium sp. CECT 9606 TaxID=2845822 RepID=UPI001E2DECB5|nr:SDR family NAD(P)-dependent oxidoreductase [Aquabacterium sp. CECT 9606]CAH0354129.1 Galactitol 2-dehydrogenase [Aquabacterium sp. CECT 9606]
MFDLTGRTAVITGGGGALGLAAAKALHDQGAAVVLLGRSLEKLQAALAQIEPASGRASVQVCDVADEASLTQAAADILSRHAKVDILVTCAAASAASGKFEATTVADWRSLLSTDLDGVFLACRIFGQSMLKNKHGRIVNLTSFHNVATYPYRTLYNTAKSGVEGLSRALAVEWGHHGITVNTVAPGPIMTPRTQWFLSQDESNKAGMLARTPTVQIGELQDVSSTIAFLASDEAKHINGQQIVIDGGWTKNAWWGDHTELE